MAVAMYPVCTATAGVAALRRATPALQPSGGLRMPPSSFPAASVPGGGYKAASPSAAASFRTTSSAAASFRAASTTASATSSEGELGGPPKVYTPDDNGAYWGTRPVTVVKRALQLGVAFGLWMGRAKFDPQRNTAEDLRNVLTRLGPAFVKIGQAVSSRPDVASPEFIAELEKLQDRIAAFPDDEAYAAIEAELGVPPAQVFSRISASPVAAASLGQVYRATLRSTGEEVAIKVQRPGVLESISLDVFLLRHAAGVLRKVGKLNTDLPSLIDDWGASLFQEMDYTTEAANATRFRELFSHMQEIHVPRIHADLTRRRVLVMEWVEGERLRTASRQLRDASTGEKAIAGDDDLTLVEVGVRCSLEQMLQEGFYHADPHPGNLLRMADGRLAYLDFGMMGQIDIETRQALIRATLNLVNREYDGLSEDFISLGLLPPDAVREEITPALTGVFKKAASAGVSQMSFGDLSSDLGRTMYQYKFRIPPYYTLMVRSLTVLEGIALASNPDYKVLSAAYPWISRKLLLDDSEELRTTLRSLLYKNGSFDFARLENLLTQATMREGRSDIPVPTAPAAGGALRIVLSPEGGFLRDILTDELAKGLDAAWRLAADAAVSETRARFAALPSLFLGNAAGEAPAPAASGQGQALLDVLVSIPSVAADEDHAQIAGLTSLAAKLTPAPTDDEVGSQLEQTTAMLRWLLNEAAALPESARAEALRLPLVVLSKTSSRVTARAIRGSMTTGAGSAASRLTA